MQPNEQPDFVSVRIREKPANLPYLPLTSSARPVSSSACPSPPPTLSFLYSDYCISSAVPVPSSARPSPPPTLSFLSSNYCAPSSSESFIFKVHKQLRTVNEKAYEPEVVAIGPYHHGKQNLEMMEKHKLRHVKQLLKWKGETSAYNLVRSLELNARRCYAEPINFTTDEFVEMLLLDGCFVIEVICKSEMNDPIFQMGWIKKSLKRDLMLFENQLPFSILCKLFDLIKDPDNDRSFMDLAFDFFHDLLPENVDRDRMHVDANSDPNNIKHLLGLIHNNWLPPYDRMKVSENDQNKRKWRFIPSVTKLLEYVVKIKKAEEGRLKVSENDQNKRKWRFIPSATELLESGVKIKKAEKGRLFNITFESGVIRIPPLTIEDQTETFLRNLIAYEQYYPDIQ